MATTVTGIGVGAAAGVGLGLGLNRTTPSPFLGKKVEVKWRERKVKPGTITVACLGGGLELKDMVESLFLGVGVGLPCTVMECGDIIYRSTLPRSNGLNITPPGVILALGALSYLWATPGVAPGFWDMFVLAFLERLFRPTFRKVRFFLTHLQKGKIFIQRLC